METRFTEPDGWQWGTFTNADGATLRYGHLSKREDAAGTVVIGPGFTEFAEKYFEVTRDLDAVGYHVWTLDWRGQGGSDRWLDDPLKPYNMGFDREARDLAQFVSKTVTTKTAAKPALIAHSMGAHIALRALHDHGELFSCAALSAPMLRFDTKPWPRPVAKLVVALAVMLGCGGCAAPADTEWRWKLPPIEEDPRSHDPARRGVHLEYYETKPELKLAGPTFGWIAQAFKSTEMMMQPDYLREIKTPILVGTAGADSIVQVEPQAELAATAPDATQRVFDGARHELWMELDDYRAPWLRAVLDFLKEHTSQDAA